ncbi:MAG: lysylphosphatidylglycerol synthase transmembrane domain-containing protein [Pseudomonadota bacterium]
MKKKLLHITGWLITLTLLGFIAFRMDWQTVIQGFKAASINYIVLAILFNFIVIGVKSLRFKWLIKVGDKLKFSKVLNATMISFAANNIFPMRGGELIRIQMLSENGKRSKLSLASISFLEKLFDAIGIVVLIPFLLLIPDKPVWLNKGAFIVIAITAVFVGISFFLKLFEKHAFIKKLTDGFKALHNAKDFFSNLVLTIISSILQILILQWMQMSLGIELPFWQTVLAFLAVNLAIMIPSAPSHLGTMEAGLLMIYSIFGLQKETALNIALMYHAVQFFPVTLTGLAVYLLNSIKSKNIVNSTA